MRSELVWVFRTSCILLAVGALSALSPDLVLSQGSVPGVISEQHDLNGDGLLDLTVIEAAFETGSDQVLVYDGAGDMQPSSEIATAVDHSNDVWLFDVGGNGDAQLIVVFDEEEGRQTARLYDDVDDDGKVAYEISGARVNVTESPHWHVKVISHDTWKLADGQVNSELEILVDGYVLRYLGWGELNPAREWGVEKIKTDGVVDWRVRIVDVDNNGSADYQLQRLQNEVPWFYAVFRSTLYVNEDAKLPTPYPNTVFWPLLVGSHDYETYNYFDHPPVIAVAWDQAKIDRLGIIGYPTEKGYHINSRVGVWQDDQVNYADFENPMAYYDLAEDHDGKPELFVRFEVFTAGDPLFRWGDSLGGFFKPVTQVEYTWDQDNNGKWDFELGMVGFHPITTTTYVGDLGVLTVPYSAIPTWTTNHRWEMATLTAAETNEYWNSEGMGEWSPDRGFRNGSLIEPSGLRDQYLTGVTDQPPLENYASARVGMRGEFSFDYDSRPSVYQSVVDAKLHLLYASHGVWQVTDSAQIRYANLDGDAYLDQWQELRAGEVIQQLNYSHDVYALSGSGEVQIRQTNVTPALFETQPPTNTAEWRQLDAELKAHQRDFAPDDFAGMLSWLGGRETHIQSASLRNYRITPQGFHFILELQAGFAVDGDTELLDLLPDAPGSYVVAYDNGAWSVRPATPVSLRASDLTVEAHGGELDALDWATLGATVHNEGTMDGHDVPICAVLDGPSGQRTAMTGTLALVPGEGQQRVVWDWAPPAAGEWRVRLTANCDGSEDGAAAAQPLAETTLQVGDRALPSPGWLVSLGGSVPTSIVLFVIAAAAMAALSAAAWSRRAVD